MSSQRRALRKPTKRAKADGLDEALTALGMGPMHVRVYRVLLENGLSTATNVSVGANVSRGRIYEVLDELIAASMVTVHEGDVLHYSAYQPEVAVASAMRRLEDQLATRRSTVARLLPQLNLEKSPQDSKLRDRVRILHDDEDIAAFQMQLFRRAKKSFLLFEKRTVFPDLSRNDVSKLEWYQTKHATMKRCPDARILVDQNVLAQEKLRERVIATINMGLQLRISPTLPFHALVIDRTDILINLPETRTSPSNPQVYFRHPGLATSIADLFDTMWAHASRSASIPLP